MWNLLKIIKYFWPPDKTCTYHLYLMDINILPYLPLIAPFKIKIKTRKYSESTYLPSILMHFISRVPIPTFNQENDVTQYTSAQRRTRESRERKQRKQLEGSYSRAGEMNIVCTWVVQNKWREVDRLKTYLYNTWLWEKKQIHKKTKRT